MVLKIEIGSLEFISVRLITCLLSIRTDSMFKGVLYKEILIQPQFLLSGLIHSDWWRTQLHTADDGKPITDTTYVLH